MTRALLVALAINTTLILNHSTIADMLPLYLTMIEDGKKVDSGTYSQHFFDSMS